MPAVSKFCHFAQAIRRTFQPTAATSPIEPTTGSLSGIDRVQTRA
jgi:hypothetical protein